MGIQSTMDITREEAIVRIIKIDHLALYKKYSSLEETTFEPDFSVENFVEKYHQMLSINSFKIDLLTEYTDEMLEKIMDKPFYRYSMFDNYLIKEELKNG